MDELFRAIERVAEQKRQRGEMLSRGVDPTVEKAQDVIADAARELAGRFADDGFSYARSAKKLSRKAGDWTQEIFFHGTGMNVPGRQIHFEVHALLKNAALKKWQKSLPSPFFQRGHAPDHVTVISQRLRDDWPTWDLHEKATRATAIDEIEAFVRNELMPLLGMFNAPHVLLERLISDTELDDVRRLVRLDQTIDLLVHYFGAEPAAQAVDAFVTANLSPDFQQRLTRAFAKIRAGHPPDDASASEVVAVAVERHMLPVQLPLLAELHAAELPAYDATEERRRTRQSASDLADVLRGAGYRVQAAGEEPAAASTFQKPAPTQRVIDREIRKMRNTSLSRTKRNNAAHMACVLVSDAGDDEVLWRLLAERLELGLVNRKTKTWPFTRQIVTALAERSQPPAGLEHVEDAYLNDPSPPPPKRPKRST